MTRCGLVLIASLVTGLTLSSAQAATPKVNDRAGFFSQGAMDDAMRKMEDIYRRYKVEVVVDTFEVIPDEMRARYDAAKTPDERNAFFARWADTRATDEAVKGVYVLICKKPGHLQIEPDKAMRQRDFTLADRNSLVQQVLPLMKEKQYDAALAKIVNVIGAAVTARQGAKPPRWRGAGSAQCPAGPIGQAGGGSMIAGWVCFGIVAFLVIWLIVAIIRAISGAGRGYGGYGGGPGGMGGGMGGGYGPGYGGGGGGFMSSLLGGMFGAAAGNWMYDSFFRGGGHSTSWGDTSQGGFGSSGQDSLPADQPGAGVYGDDTGGGGGDFGGDSSSDTGGGGDFGGSDDSGGDFGGGGGDFGGGSFGGGDFGGGDFGGGGDSGGGDF